MQIDMATGQKVDTDLYGCVTCSSGQQQRTYKVYPDPDFIRWALGGRGQCKACHVSAGAARWLLPPPSGRAQQSLLPPCP